MGIIVGGVGLSGIVWFEVWLNLLYLYEILFLCWILFGV